MKRRTRRWLSILAVGFGAVGGAGAVLMKMKNAKAKPGFRENGKPGGVWARPGMQVTFRAELMPGRDASERVFRVKELLPSGRVVLHDFSGEHAEKEFERIR
jgi:hypothetical protein